LRSWGEAAELREKEELKVFEWKSFGVDRSEKISFVYLIIRE